MAKKKEKNLKKKTKIGIIILSVLLIFIIITAIGEINRLIHLNQIEKIASESDVCPDVVVESVVYTNLLYVYIQNSACEDYVYYKNGTKESLSIALYLHHLSVRDLEKFNVSLLQTSIFDVKHKHLKEIGKTYNPDEDESFYKVKNIENSSQNDDTCLDMVDIFYSDNLYDYSFNCLNEDIIVSYTNGKTEEIHEAFKNNHVSIRDLDKFNIKYQKFAKSVTATAIITGVTNSGCTTNQFNFYSDENYNYYLKNSCYTVKFSDGTKEPIEEAFKNNKLSLKDLNRLEFPYTKEAK